jgi:hypothetical protein
MIESEAQVGDVTSCVAGNVFEVANYSVREQGGGKVAVALRHRLLQ